MSSSGVENIDVLRPALAFLRLAFGYEYAHQDSAAFHAERQDFNEAILYARLLRKLREFNPDRSEEELRNAVHDLISPVHASLPLIQKELYEKMLATSWRAASVAASSQTSLHYFDFENPSHNEFFIVEHFQFAGPSGLRTLDAVLFVNGIPLAVFEARALHEREGLRRGLEHLQNLQASGEIPRIFNTIHLLVILQKDAAGYGSVAMAAEHLQSWEDSSPLSWEELRAVLRRIPYRDHEVPTVQDILLAGMFSPKNFLELFRHFTAFVTSTGSAHPEKKLTRFHQFQAVQMAYARLHKRELGSLSVAGGTIVHPYGTGKSYALFWLACKLWQEARAAQHILLMLTERPALIELCKAGWQQRGWTDLTHLPLESSLTQALQQRKTHALIASPEQFRRTAKPQNDNIEYFPGLADTPMLVLLDEAQRSDYAELVLDVERALPLAAIVAFTSFPVQLETTLNSRCLQHLIHQYTSQQAQREGYLVPLKLESRLPEWHIEDREWNERAASFSIEMPAVKNSQATPAEGKNEIRLQAIGDDIFLHFSQDIAANGNLALLAAADYDMAMRYFELLEEKMPGKVAAFLPSPKQPSHARQPKMKMQVRHLEPPEKVLQRFAARDEPGLLIVVENLPGHLFMPKLQALYLDRPLRGLAWWEASALLQHTGGQDKTFGLVIDYWGTFRFALDLEETAGITIIENRYAESQFEDLRAWRRELLALLDYSNICDRSEQSLAVLASVEKRTAFAKAWQRFARGLDQMLPKILHAPLWQEACCWDQLRQEAAAFYFDEALSAAPTSQKLRRLFEEEERLRGPSRIREGASLYGQDFWQELETFETLAVKNLRLLHVLHHETRRAAPADPVFYQALEQRLQRIEIERQLGRLDEVATYAKLREEALRLRVEKGERSAATHQLAFLGILQKFMPREDQDLFAQRGQHEKLAGKLLAALAPEIAIVDWTKKESVQREMRRKIKHLLREAHCPQNLQDHLSAELMKIARARLA